MNDFELGELIRENAIEPEASPEFENKVVRTARLDFHARTFKFWAPALVGGLIAAVGVLALIETIVFVPAAKPVKSRAAEARLAPSPTHIPESIGSSDSTTAR